LNVPLALLRVLCNMYMLLPWLADRWAIARPFEANGWPPCDSGNLTPSAQGARFFAPASHSPPCPSLSITSWLFSPAARTGMTLGSLPLVLTPSAVVPLDW
jgi:hypothetical protein